MALNCAMLTATRPPRPVPLPREKVFLDVAHVTGELQGMSSSTAVSPTSAALTATGTVYITNLRIVFVADEGARLPSTGSAQRGQELRSLSVNLDRYVDGRLIQPWFSANYYESLVLPQQGGGLSSLHRFRVHFKEGRAYEFYTAIEEVKARFAESHGGGGGAQDEALPLYEPPAPGPSSAPSSSGPLASSSTSTSTTAPPSIPARSSGQQSQHTVSSAHAATSEDVQAANCALQAEQHEQDEAVRASTIAVSASQAASRSGNTRAGMQLDMDGPPSYEAAAGSRAA